MEISLPMLIPLPILFGIYYSVIYPLRNALHIDANVVNQATQMLSKIPGVSSTFASHYAEIEIIKHFDSLRDYLTMFSAEDVDKIESFSHGFKFLGLDLLATPQGYGIDIYAAGIDAQVANGIPNCLVTSLLMQLVTTKMQPASASQQQQGCMKYMLYGMSLFTAYLAFTMPGAVGFYWAIQNVLGIGQSFVTMKFFGQTDLVARSEAARVARRELEEAKVKEIPLNQQIEIRKTLEAKLSASTGGKNPAKEKSDKNQLPAEKKGGTEAQEQDEPRRL